MQIKVKLFAILREITGQNEINLEVSSEISCGEILSRLQEGNPSLFPLLERCFVALNGRYVDKEVIVSEEDEVAVLPPVSGG